MKLGFRSGKLCTCLAFDANGAEASKYAVGLDTETGEVEQVPTDRKGNPFYEEDPFNPGSLITEFVKVPPPISVYPLT